MKSNVFGLVATLGCILGVYAIFNRYGIDAVKGSSRLNLIPKGQDREDDEDEDMG